MFGERVEAAIPFLKKICPSTARVIDRTNKIYFIFLLKYEYNDLSIISWSAQLLKLNL